MPPKVAPESVMTSEEDQARLLNDAKKVVKEQAFYMKRCLDTNKLMDALKHASNMMCELRTSLLSPKNYYELYMIAFDQLRHLESYLLDGAHGKRMPELYELVQYAGNILPRLYLLITVGSVYIQTKEAPAKDVLRDLVEMCRGVQHPTRGLFLRTYLSEMTKDKLPDVGSNYEGTGGTVREAVEFVLSNFVEMNKLWVRMQHQGPHRDKERREAERTELRLLVGKNLARLSQLEGVNADMYAEILLPRIAEQVVSCKDRIAQQYLAECVVQAFPDEFHLRTLAPLLDMCGQLTAHVDVRLIVVALLDRLANYASREPGAIAPDSTMFSELAKQVATLIEQRPTMALDASLALHAALAGLAARVHPERLDYIDSVLQAVLTLMAAAAEKSADTQKSQVVRQLTALLRVPLEQHKDVLKVLQLKNYTALMPYLTYSVRKRVATDIVRTALDSHTSIPTAETADTLLSLIAPLLRDQPDQDETDNDEFQDEQHLVCSLVHLFTSDSPAEQYKIFITVRKHFKEGGALRMSYTMVPLVFRALNMAIELAHSEMDGWEGAAKKLFAFVHDIVKTLSAEEATGRGIEVISMRLLLKCAHAASECGFDEAAYEFVSMAFVIYEESISDSQAQFDAVILLIGTLYSIDCFDDDQYDTLITKAALHSFRLLLKPHQVRALCAASHLFWTRRGTEKEHRDGKRMIECLQRALKIADKAMEDNVALFVETLNEYLYYFERQCDQVSVEDLSRLIALINEHMANSEASIDQSVRTHFDNTISHIKQKRASGHELSGLYARIEIGR